MVYFMERRDSGPERSPPSQAALLRGRGDLKNSKLRWKADLADTSSVHLRASPMERLGFHLKHGAQSMGLCVRGIADEYRGRDTPIVEYNIRQERRHQSLFKIHPGDRIRAVNRSEAYDEMIRELHTASEKESELCICLEREMKDVLEVKGAPSPSANRMWKSLSEGTLATPKRRSLSEALGTPKKHLVEGALATPQKKSFSETLGTPKKHLAEVPERPPATPALPAQEPEELQVLDFSPPRPRRLRTPAPSPSVPSQASARGRTPSPRPEAVVRRSSVARFGAKIRRSNSLGSQVSARDRARSPSPLPGDSASSWLPSAVPPVVTISRSPAPSSRVGA